MMFTCQLFVIVEHKENAYMNAVDFTKLLKFLSQVSFCRLTCELT